MSAIDFDKVKHELMAKTINKKLLNELFKLFDEFDIEEWKDVRYLELADIWCETVEKNSVWNTESVKYDDLLEREFSKAVLERMCGYERERK